MENQTNIIEKLRNIKENKEQNKFLNLIHEDYSKYYDHIVNQKYKSIIALMNIYYHLKSIEKTNEIANENLLRTKIEQKETLDKIYNIKRELDLMIHRQK